jgi:excisionase family DNA binding protein
MLTVEVPVSTLDADQLRALYEMLQQGVPTLMGQHGEEMALPSSLYRVLKETARNLQMGLPVSVIAEEEKLSTQMAAHVLGCSRPHVVKLLDGGEMPFEMVGVHRRICYRDLLAYQRRRDAARHEALNEMSKQAVAWGKYDGVPPGEDESDV